MRMISQSVFRRVFALLFFLLACACPYFLSAISLGEHAPAFTAKSLDGRAISLDTYQGKIVILEWSNPQSSYVHKYYTPLRAGELGYIPALQKQWAHPLSNVVWLTIIPTFAKTDLGSLIPQWKSQLTGWQASPTSVLLDEDKKIGNLYDVAVTPEVCIIDGNGILVYRGAVDSIHGDDPRDLELVSNLHWFRNALENAHAHEPIYPNETLPYGSDIKE